LPAPWGKKGGFKSPEPDPDRFDWADEENIVLPEQRATAVYFNKAGELIIRQQAAWDDDGDSFIFVSKRFQDEFIDKLTDAMGIPTLGRPQPERQSRK
jgi:hypothetical protein